MRSVLSGLLFGLLLLFPSSSLVLARSGGSSYHSYSSGGSTHVRGYIRKDGTYVHPHERQDHGSYGGSRSRSTSPWSSTDSYGLQRDSHGRIVRSEVARHEFMRMHPCPCTGRTSGPCPGYVIDHIQALKHGGADSPSNMQWQTVEAAKAKDRVE